MTSHINLQDVDLLKISTEPYSIISGILEKALTWGMISGTTQLYQARPISNDRIGQAGFKNRSGVQNKGHTAAYSLCQERSPEPYAMTS